MKKINKIVLESNDDEIKKVILHLLNDFYNDYNFNFYTSIKECIKKEKNLSSIDLLILDHCYLNDLVRWRDVHKCPPQCKLIILFKGNEFIANAIKSLNHLNILNEVDYIITDNYSSQLKFLLMKDLIYKIL